MCYVFFFFLNECKRLFNNAPALKLMTASAKMGFFIKANATQDFY